MPWRDPASTPLLRLGDVFVLRVGEVLSRLTSSGGGTGKSNVSLTLPKSDCQSDYARFVAGRFKGSFTQSPLSCATLSATSTQMVGTANWSTGFHNGLNFVRWSPSTVNGTVVNGSLAGHASLRVNVSGFLGFCLRKPGGGAVNEDHGDVH